MSKPRMVRSGFEMRMVTNRHHFPFVLLVAHSLMTLLEEKRRSVVAYGVNTTAENKLVKASRRSKNPLATTICKLLTLGVSNRASQERNR